MGQAGEVVGEVVTSGYQPSVTARQTTLIPDFQAAPAVAVTPNELRNPDLEYRRVAVKSEEVDQQIGGWARNGRLRS